jgi:streptogramin lyase
MAGNVIILQRSGSGVGPHLEKELSGSNKLLFIDNNQELTQIDSSSIVVDTASYATVAGTALSVDATLLTASFITVEELQSLDAGQTAVTMSVVDTASLAVYVEGIRINSTEFTKTGPQTITLAQSYSSGSSLLLVKNDQNGDVLTRVTSSFVTVEENQSLASGQTGVTMSVVTTDNLAVYVEGVRLRNNEFTKDTNNRITLSQSYPSGSQIILVQNDQSGTSIVTASYIESQNVITPSVSSNEGTLYDWQNLQESIGIIDGGEITDNGDGTIAVNSGSLFIKSTDSIRGELLISTFSSASSLVVNPVDDQVYFYVDYNAGSPTVLSSSVHPNGDHTKVLLGSVVREAPIELHIADEIQQVGHSGFNLLQQRYRAVTNFARESGGIPTISSSLYINITAGEWWQGLTEFSTPAYDSFDTQFEHYYQSASIWKSYFANQLDNSIYNDISTGTTASLSPNNYAVHWLYLETDGDVVAILGTENHPNFASAEDELAPSTTPAHVSVEHARLIARIITKEGDSSFSQVDTTYRQTFEAGTATSHDSLANLQGGQSGEYYHLTQTEHDTIILDADTASMLANNVYISQSGQNATLGNITAGTITADELHITETTRSVLYESGSTKFGDTLDDTHQFTGSVSITGSLTVNGGNTTTLIGRTNITGSVYASASFDIDGDVTASAVNASEFKQGSRNIVNRMLHSGIKSTAVGATDRQGNAFPFNETAGIKHTPVYLSGSNNRGMVFDGKYIVLGPLQGAGSGNQIERYDPSTGELVDIGVVAANTWYTGLTFDGDKYWILPYNRPSLAQFLAYDKDTFAVSANINIPDATARPATFTGIFTGKYIICPPYNSNRIYRVDTTTNTIDTASLSTADQAGIAYLAGCWDGEHVWAAPYNSANILKINPETFETQSIAHGQPEAGAFYGACFDGTHVWLPAFNSSNILKINAQTNEITEISHGSGSNNNLWLSAVFDGSSIWMLPRLATTMLKIDPSTNKIRSINMPITMTQAFGGIFDGEKIWINTLANEETFYFRPNEFSDAGVFTSGYLTVSGSAKFHTNTLLGSNLNNTHRITGSVSITGSLTVNGEAVGAAGDIYISQSGQNVNLGNITASAVTASVLKASEGIFQGSDQNIVNKIVHMGKSSTQVGGSDISTGIVPFNQTAKTLITQSVSFPGSRDNVFDGKYIWNGPFDNGIFSKIDPSTGEVIEQISTGLGTQTHIGTCFDGENIWVGSYTTGNNFFLKFNVSSSTISQVGTTVAVTAACLYGQVYDGKYVWAMPYTSGQLYRIDPTTDTVASSSLAGSAQWAHAVFDGKNVWGISYNSPNLLKITDPENFTYELIPHGQGTTAFFGACFDGTHIWISPNSANNILKVNVETNEITTIAHGLGDGQISRCVFDGNSVWMTTRFTNILKINPQTNEITTIPRPWSHNNSLGLLFDGEKIWSATFQTNDYTIFYPPEYGEPNLFTSGDLRIGGDTKIAGNITASGIISASSIIADTITANELHITETSRSVLYESGSTKFGDTLDDTHQFTGSVSISGSLTLNGNEIDTAKAVKATITQANSFTALQAVTRESGNWVTSSYISSSFADVEGVVESATGADFVVVYSGELAAASHGFTVGSTLFLSASGELSQTDPSTPSYISKPVGTPIDSDTILIQNFRGVEISGVGGDVAFTEETVQISASQTQVTFNNISTDEIEVFVEGIRLKDDEYTVNNSATITLLQTYPSGSDVTGVVATGELSAFGITEEIQSLDAGQTAVTMSVATTKNLAVYVEGVRLDSTEFTKDATQRITLASSYFSGSTLLLVNNDVAGISDTAATSASLIYNDSGVSGSNVADALDYLESNIYVSQSGQNVNLGNITASAVTASVLNATDGIYQGTGQNIVNKIVHQGISQNAVGSQANAGTGIMPYYESGSVTFTSDTLYDAGQNRGMVYDGKYVVVGPFTQDKIRRFDPATRKEVDSVVVGSGASQWWHTMVWDGTYYWLCPYSRTNFIQFLGYDKNLVLQKNIFISDAEIGRAIGYVYTGKYIVGIPYTGTKVIRLDTTTDTITTSSYSIAGPNKWGSAVYDGEYVWGIPYDSSDVIKVHPETLETQSFAHGQAAAAYWGAAWDGQNIWAAPMSAANFMKINPATGELTFFPNNTGENFSEVEYDGNNLICLPRTSGTVVKIDPVTLASQSFDAPAGAGLNNWGSCFDGEKVWSWAISNAPMFTVRANEWGETGLWTGGDLSVSGSATLHTDTKFGDSLGNTHQFTGSVSITGSLTVNGGNTTTLIGRTNLSGSVYASASFDIDGDVTASYLKANEGIRQGSDQNIVNKILHVGNTSNQLWQNGHGGGSGATPFVEITDGIVSQSIEDATGDRFGAVFDGEYLYQGFNTGDNRMVKRDITTGEIVEYISNGNVNGRWVGCVYDGQNIWSMPNTSLNFLKYNIKNKTFTEVSASASGTSLFGTFDGKYIWTMPWSDSNIYRVNTIDNTVASMSVSADIDGTQKMYGAVFDGKNVWGIPYGSDHILKITDTESMVTESFAHGQVGVAFRGGCFDGTHIWMASSNIANILKVNIETNEITEIPHNQGTGTARFNGCVFDGNSVWFPANYANNTLKVNPQDNSFVEIPRQWTNNMWHGTFFDGEKIWTFANSTNTSYFFYPFEFANSKFTTNDMRVGRDLIVNGSTKLNSISETLTVENTTTDATQTTLFTDGVSGRINLATSESIMFKADILGSTTGSQELASYTLQGVADRGGDASTIRVANSILTTIYEDVTSWDVDVTGSIANSSIDFLVTGEASKTINWVAKVELTKLTTS